MQVDTARWGIVEREQELALVADTLDAAAAGTGGLLVLEGPAGIGKTSLMRAARDLAAEREIEVLVARGADFERDFGYGVARQLLERPLLTGGEAARDRLLAGAAAGAAAPLGLPGADVSASGPAATLAAPHALYWLVANLAEQHPVLLLVDDAHWADSASLRFLNYLARRQEGMCVALVVAFRPDEPTSDREALGRFAAEPSATSVRIAPLSGSAVATVVGDRLGNADSSFAAACEQATGGNPLLLRELIAALEAGDVDPTADNVQQIRGLGPRAVARSVLLRVGDLEPAVADVARAVAVLGDRATLRETAKVARLDLEVVARAADTLAGVDVLERDRPLRFVHPIVRKAIYADMAPAARAAAHGRAARALEAVGAPADAIAHHLAETDPAGDGSVAARLVVAADDALTRGAPDAVVRYLRRALSEPPADDTRADVLAKLGEAELRAGRPAESAEHLEAAIAVAPPGPQRARLRHALARAAMATNEVPTALDRFAAALAEAESVDPRLARELEADMAGISWQTPDLTRQFMARADDWELLPGETAAELALIGLAGRARIAAGQAVTRGHELTLRCVTDDRLLERAGPSSPALHIALYGLFLCDDLEAFDAAVARIDRVGRERGDVLAGLTVALMRGFGSLRRGRAREAEAYSLDAIAATDAAMLHPLAAPVIVAVLAKAQLAQGRTEDAARTLDDIGLDDQRPGTVALNWLVHARALLRMTQGRYEDALEDARCVGELDEPAGQLNPAVPWRSTAAQASLRLGRKDEARALAREWLELADAFGARVTLGEALRGAARVEPDGDARFDFLRRSEEQLRDSPARGEFAETLCDLGAALRRAGRRTEAQQKLREAHDIAGAGGLHVLAERAGEELRAAGARPRALMHSGVDALTASERRVADMAAAGASNKQIAQELFVTAKTVENHLGRVYTKLAIHSRAELRDALANVV